MVPTWPWLVVVGALLVSAALVWYALALGAQIRAALAPRYEFTVRAYIGAACLMPFGAAVGAVMAFSPAEPWQGRLRSEEHTSELQSRGHLVCRLLLELTQ